MLTGIAIALALAALIGVCVLSRWLSELTCRLERLETLNAKLSSLSGQASLKLLRPAIGDHPPIRLQAKYSAFANEKPETQVQRGR